uniref:Uncharacterized protein n=1 Tax=Candidatus Kentrum sp. FM TaxID=2126340 RepID=A0A450SGG6_9GAMM|nr:MAG: hypothetical protein BECKFM1743A_GA0114220_1003112 [Candidatus Kentron sp. FM]VFJ52139.1 MAG: hypothetical protein BECKFM1743C_GA0114222_101065 [Candidatus Kentron sp. FM]VFK09130.1 MAG: hypothetical protein BECKFM1743B_GA0114221_100965 [Candidatus Kentron sp. FM]
MTDGGGVDDSGGNREGKRNLRIGGGYLESFGYDTTLLEDEVKNPQGLVTATHCGKKKHRFSLSDVIGTSSAAPQEILLGFEWDDLGFPEFKHWPVSDRKTPQATVEYSHGDGGHIDNLGIMPLLARQVDKILVFVNTARRFSPYPGANGSQPTPGDLHSPIYDDVLSDDLIALFRLHDNFPFNVVFKEGDEKLSELYSAFTVARSSGAPLVHCDTYPILDNHRYNITAVSASGTPKDKYTPNICWVYLDLASQWHGQLTGLPRNVVGDIVQGKGDFEEFPHYKTFLQNGVRVIDLSLEQVNALSNLTSWSVIQSADRIRDGLDLGGRFPLPRPWQTIWVRPSPLSLPGKVASIRCSRHFPVVYSWRRSPKCCTLLMTCSNYPCRSIR